jgi:hypothetical protein
MLESKNESQTKIIAAETTPMRRMAKCNWPDHKKIKTLLDLKGGT